MSAALKALVLLRVYAWRGEWLGLNALAAHIGLHADLVRAACDELVAAGQLEHATHCGEPMYGVRCEGAMPGPNGSRTPLPPTPTEPDR